jgi:uncharacterized membrane protein
MSAPPQRYSHKISWAVFIGMLLLAALFVNQTASELPKKVAVHFDAAGQATSFMTVGHYRLFILLFAIGLPLAVVATMATAYSRAAYFKLPNRDYWLAPPRLARTRSFLIAHGIWFGSLLVGLMCFMHWLILDANRQEPPYLSNQSVFTGLLIILGCMIVWIGVLMAAFRRPSAA